MKTSHLGLVEMKNEKIISVRYIETKFERNLGDKMTIEGKSFQIVAMADNRNSVIDYLNKIMKIVNAPVVAANRAATREANRNFNNALNEAIRYVNSL